jgi:hypothetical protein
MVQGLSLDGPKLVPPLGRAQAAFKDADKVGLLSEWSHVRKLEHTLESQKNAPKLVPGWH